jgi:hypothetical protein
MILALGADIEIPFNLFGIDDFVAVFTFRPDPLGDLFFPLFDRRQRRLFFAEPAHMPPGYVGISRNM